MHAHKQRNGKASHGWGANLYDSTMWVEVIGLRSSSWGDRNLQELVCCHLARLEDTPLSNWTAGGGPGRGSYYFVTSSTASLSLTVSVLLFFLLFPSLQPIPLPSTQYTQELWLTHCFCWLVFCLLRSFYILPAVYLCPLSVNLQLLFCNHCIAS